MNRMKYLLAAIWLMIATDFVIAEEQTSAQASYVVSPEQEQDIRLFLDKKPFRNCVAQQAKLQLQYGFGSIVLTSKVHDKTKACVVRVQREVEMGLGVAEECSINGFESIDWVRNKMGEVIFMPPSCANTKFDKMFYIEKEASPQALTDFLNSIDVNKCQVEDTTVRYKNEDVKLVFYKKDQACIADIRKVVTSTVLGTCPINVLRETGWFYNEQGVIRDSSPRPAACMLTPAEQRREAVKSLFSFIFAMFFSAFFGGSTMA